MKMRLLIIPLMLLCYSAWGQVAASTAGSTHMRISRVPAQRQFIPPGHYSGISYIEGDRFAVVHDKCAGAGLHFFDIQIDQDGYPFVTYTEECAGNASQPGNQDSEGVVYVPESNTLFVSAETFQTILEYTLDGIPTGRSLEIPEDLKNTQPNAGFEALGYGNGLFWTVTEKNLPADEDGLLRLQSFDAHTLQAGPRYLYRCEKPVIPEEASRNATAYVFGVPAITVLPGGQLLVLEREVYVPSGKLSEKARHSSTFHALYLVDPLHDTSHILQKKLLTRFSTKAVNLANYEGMCLGPQLPDGRWTLLLIADSQGGMDGLTGEYLKVFLLKI